MHGYDNAETGITSRYKVNFKKNKICMSDEDAVSR